MEYSSIQTEKTSVITHKNLAANRLPNQASENKANSGLETVQDQESAVSDCESICFGGNSSQFPDGLIRLFRGDKFHDLIKQRFLTGLGLLGTKTKVVSIYRNSFSSLTGQARMQSFQIFTKAMEKKCGDNINAKYAWYADTKEEICQIMNHGFGPQMIDGNNGLFGHGIYLSPDDSPLECVKKLSVDKDGLRHLMLCRVLLGKSEVVPPGSEQWHPRSEEFDSGVDSLASPKKYIVWSTHMNTHILPEYVISFEAPSCLKGYSRIPESSGRPTSPWMPFSTLISALSEFLPPTDIRLLGKYHRNLREKKISRQEMVQQLRRIAGDKLLISVIKSFKAMPSNFSKKWIKPDFVDAMDES